MRLLLSRRAFGLGALALLGGCSPAPEDGTRLRLGFMARLTHAPALTGLESGRFETALAGVRLEARAFEVGNASVEALFAGDLDAAYLGPNPAINGFVRSRGAIAIASGAAEGGSAFVVRADSAIRSAEDLHAKRLASPEIASTQDIALRTYLARRGLSVGFGRRDVAVLPLSTPELRVAFRRGEIDGAWLSEPLASELVLTANARVFVDEADEWPGRRHPTTVLVARTRFLEAHPELVAGLIRAHADEVGFVEHEREEALALSRRGIERVLGKRLPEPIARRAFARVRFTTDPMPDALTTLAENARALGFLPEGSLAGLTREAAP